MSELDKISDWAAVDRLPLGTAVRDASGAVGERMGPQRHQWWWTDRRQHEAPALPVRVLEIGQAGPLLPWEDGR